MGGNHKSGLSVLWMPRKKKHHHNHKRQDNNVFKSGKTRQITFGGPGHSASGSPGLFSLFIRTDWSLLSVINNNLYVYFIRLLGESRPADPAEKPVDIKLSHLNIVGATVDNPSTSAKEDHNAIENVCIILYWSII